MLDSILSDMVNNINKTEEKVDDLVCKIANVITTNKKGVDAVYTSALIQVEPLLSTFRKEMKSISYDDSDELLSDIRSIILRQPIVEAIQIDPLSKWLAVRYEPPYSYEDVQRLVYPWEAHAKEQAEAIWKQALRKINDKQ